jgi:mannose/fructose/N-acetylgalactosamine-specific phosphotransferase system component IIB
MKIKQNGGVQEALKVVNSCKPFLSKVLLIIKSVHDIVTIAKKLESNVSKATESNTSKDTNNYISVDNELVETSSKRQKTLNLFTPQTRNANMAILIMVRVLPIPTT